MKDFEFKIPDGVKNAFMNALFVERCPDEETKKLAIKCLQVFNNHGITSDKAMPLLLDLGKAMDDSEAEK